MEFASVQSSLDEISIQLDRLSVSPAKITHEDMILTELGDLLAGLAQHPDDLTVWGPVSSAAMSAIKRVAVRSLFFVRECPCTITKSTLQLHCAGVLALLRGAAHKAPQEKSFLPLFTILRVSVVLRHSVTIKVEVAVVLFFHDFAFHQAPPFQCECRTVSKSLRSWCCTRMCVFSNSFDGQRADTVMSETK